MYEGDIKDFGRSSIRRDLGILVGEVDLVVGGPPCQAYSTVGKRLLDDPRGQLFQEYFRVLSELKPRAFIFENVKGLISMSGGDLLPTIIDKFESLGYSVNWKLLNAADFGVPQTRERVIITGSLCGNFSFPRETHGDPEDNSLWGKNLSHWVTLGDAIGDLPFISSGDESFEYSSSPQNEFQKLMRFNAPKKIRDHNAPVHNATLLRMIHALPEGGSPADIPKSLRPKSGFPNTYSRLWWGRPSTTVTRNLGTPSSSRCVHPYADRGLTTREGARIQCFPDSYLFHGTRTDKNLQIGNAVPTFLSKVLSKQMQKLLSE
jgi:DNA (cytosine-5)-methyltransferase 1